MKQTYVGRSPILTLLTFFTLVLGSQWTFGQTFNFNDGSIPSEFTNGCATSRDIVIDNDPTNSSNKVLKYYRPGDSGPTIGTSAKGRGFTLTPSSLEDGKNYNISYKVYSSLAVTKNVAQDKYIGLQINGDDACNVISTSMNNTHDAMVSWETYDVPFTAQASNEIIFRFAKIDAVHYVDDITITCTDCNPTISINSSDVSTGNSTATNPINLTFTISDTPVGFDASDVTISGGTGTLSPLSGSGNTYITTFEADADGDYSISVAAGKFQVNGNNNLASNTFTYSYDSSLSISYETATIESTHCNSNNSLHKITLPFLNATSTTTYNVSITPTDQGINITTPSFNNVTEGNIVLTDVPPGIDVLVTLNDGTSDFTSDLLNATACSSNDYIGNKAKWSDPTVWSEGRVPNANDDVVVKGATGKNSERINFDEAAEVRDITFEIRMDIKNGGSLKCINIELENDYNQLTSNTSSNGSYPSLIYTGTLTKSANCNIAFTRYVAGTNNDLVSSPFDNEEFYDFVRSATTKEVLDSLETNTTTGIARYINSNEGYVTWDKTDNQSKFELGKGYAIGVKHKTETVDGKTNTYKQVRFNSKYADNNALNLVSNTLDKKVSLDRTDINGTDNPWNLIGNPYLAYYDLAEFLSDNAGAIDNSYEAIYGYNNGTFDTYNSSNASTRHIAPGTAFFVAAATNSSEITFKPGNRKTYTESVALSGATGDDFNSARSNTSVERFDLVISDGDKNFKTNFYFDNNVTAGLDRGYDAGSFNAKSQNLAIYSVLADNSSELDLSIQALPLDKLEKQKVKLGVNAKAGNNYSISLENNSFENQSIFITDRESNQVFDLTKGAYNFSVNTELEGTERFEISFQSEALSQQKSLLNQLQVVTHNHTITVIGDIESNTSLKVYDLQGRVIAQKVVSNDSREIRLDNQNTGVYVLSISNTNGQRTQKVILK